MITAKIQCQHKQEHAATASNDRQAVVSFGPDYADGRNKAWAAATPHLELRMTLNGKAADLFEQGKRYTLQFVEDTED